MSHAVWEIHTCGRGQKTMSTAALELLLGIQTNWRVNWVGLLKERSKKEGTKLNILADTDGSFKYTNEIREVQNIILKMIYQSVFTFA